MSNNINIGEILSNFNNRMRAHLVDLEINKGLVTRDMILYDDIIEFRRRYPGEFVDAFVNKFPRLLRIKFFKEKIDLWEEIVKTSEVLPESGYKLEEYVDHIYIPLHYFIRNTPMTADAWGGYIVYDNKLYGVYIDYIIKIKFKTTQEFLEKVKKSCIPRNNTQTCSDFELRIKNKDISILWFSLRNLLKEIFENIRENCNRNCDNEEISGNNPNNICNKCKSGAGVQLEISSKLRNLFEKENGKNGIYKRFLMAINDAVKFYLKN